MQNIFNIGDTVSIKNVDYARERNTVGKRAEVVKGNISKFNNLVRFENGDEDHYQDNELELVSLHTEEQPRQELLIIQSPNFNVSEITCGSLIYINKGYLQLQGFVADITPTTLTVAYYDGEETRENKCSLETVNVSDVFRGEQSFELIRKAIPLEVSGT